MLTENNTVLELIKDANPIIGVAAAIVVIVFTIRKKPSEDRNVRMIPDPASLRDIRRVEEKADKTAADLSLLERQIMRHGEERQAALEMKLQESHERLKTELDYQTKRINRTVLGVAALCAKVGAHMPAEEEG